MRPSVFPALVSLSLLLAAACRLPLASITLMSGVAAAHNNLAIAYEKKGAGEEAQKEYEAALGLAPDNPTIKDNLERFKRRQEAARPDKGPATRGGNVADSAPGRGR